LILNAHDGYISWEEYQNNQKKLLENAQANGADRKKGPPREGPALLQGLVVCGVCGKRMTIRYHNRKGKLIPTYVCQIEGIKTGNPICQSIPGHGIDKAIEKRLIEIISPEVLELALRVQNELDSRLEETDLLRQQGVERAKYEADIARRRYMQTDPDNRLVAATLEAEWNNKLKALEEAKKELEEQRKSASKKLDSEIYQQILSLSADFSLLWNDESTTDRERKRIIRLLIEDVTLTKKADILMQIRYRGGKLETLSTPKALSGWQQTQTPLEALEKIDALLDDYSNDEVARILNQQGKKTGFGRSYNTRLVTAIIKRNGIKSRYERLKDRGLLTLEEMTEKLDVNSITIKKWHKAGLLEGYSYNSKNECLYVYALEGIPIKMPGVKHSKRKKINQS
jgi:hypothetical protein